MKNNEFTQRHDLVMRTFGVLMPMPGSEEPHNMSGLSGQVICEM